MGWTSWTCWLTMMAGWLFWLLVWLFSRRLERLLARFIARISGGCFGWCVGWCCLAGRGYGPSSSPVGHGARASVRSP